MDPSGTFRTVSEGEFCEVRLQDPASLAFSPSRWSRRTLQGSIMSLGLGVALHPVVVVATTKGKEN